MNEIGNAFVSCKKVDHKKHYQQLFESKEMALCLLESKEEGVVVKQEELDQRSQDLLFLFCSQLHLFEGRPSSALYSFYLAGDHPYPLIRSSFDIKQLYAFYHCNTSLVDYIRQQLLPEIESCYLQTLHHCIESSILFPNLIQPKTILKIAVFYKLQQLMPESEEEQQYYLTQLRHLQLHDHQTINTFCLSLLIHANQLLVDYVKQPWKLRKQYILDRMLHQVTSHINAKILLLPKYIHSKSEQLIQTIQNYIVILIENLYELIDTVVQILLNHQCCVENIQVAISELVNTQLNRMIYDYYELSFLEFMYPHYLQTFFTAIKDSYQMIVNDFLQYLLKLSMDSNVKFHQINQALQQNYTLSNQDSYSTIIKEYSKYIIKRAAVLLDDTFFFRPEYDAQSTEFVKSSIQLFFNLVENIRTIEIPWKHDCKSFIQQFKTNNIIIENNLQSTVQIIDRKPSICYKYNDRVFPLNQLNLLKEFHEIFVIETTSYENKATLIKVKEEGMTEHFLLQEYENQQVLSPQFNLQNWKEREHESGLEIPLVHYLSLNYSLNHNKSQYLLMKGVENTKDINKLVQLEELRFQNPSIKSKKYKVPKKPTKFSTGGGVLAAKALASGIGTFIVDCMDEDIPWEDKFRNAGSSTFFAIMVGFLSARLPFIGIIIQQVLLGYAIVITWRNYVINTQERLKNLFHLIFQIAVVVTCSLVGEAIISPKIWGIIVGGIVGGVLIGIYSKFLIPRMKDNLILMLSRIEGRMRADGSLPYEAVRQMRMDEQTFANFKPPGISDDAFLSMILFCLANELRYQFRQESEKRAKKLEKKGQSAERVRMKLIDVEVALAVWRDVRKSFKGVSVYENSDVLHQTIVGLVENFNVYY